MRPNESEASKRSMGGQSVRRVLYVPLFQVSTTRTSKTPHGRHAGEAEADALVIAVKKNGMQIQIPRYGIEGDSSGLLCDVATFRIDFDRKGCGIQMGCSSEATSLLRN